MAEPRYTVYLKSNDGVGTNNISKTFYVNWESVLDRKYKRFLVKGFFRATESEDNTNDFLNIRADGFSIYGWESKTAGKTHILTIAEFAPGQTHNIYIPSYDTPLRSVMIDRPTENNLTITIQDFTQTTLTTAPADWGLWLEFSPVKNDE